MDKPGVKSKQYHQRRGNIDSKLIARFVRQRDCDVHFIVGPKRVRMAAHKSVLILYCQAFDRLISKVDGRVLCGIPNISADNFKAMLRFIYGFSITITETNMIQLNSVAHKYEIEILRNCCRDFYIRIINKDNALQYLCGAFESRESDLIKLCLKVIDQNTGEIIASDYFLKLNWKIVAMILERDELDVKEIELLKALIKWAQFQCNHYHIESNGHNLFKMMANCLCLIRFPLINIVDIAECLSKSGLYNALMHKTLFHQLLNKINTKKRGFNKSFAIE